MQKKAFPMCAVIGCGDWGKNLVRTLSSLNALGAIVERNESRAQELEAAYGVPILKFDEVLRDPKIEACFIATSGATHASLSNELLSAGKHIFIEKPITYTIQDAKNLYGDAQRLGLYVMAGHLLLYHPVFQKIQEIIQSGSLGDIRLITTRRQNFGKFFKDESVLWDLGPHDLSMILALLSNQKLILKQTQKSVLYARGEITDVIDVALFFEGEVAAHMTLSRMSPIKEQTLIVTGTKGILCFDDTNPWAEKLKFISLDLKQENPHEIPVCLGSEFIHVPQEEPLKQECLAFLMAIKEKKKPIQFEEAIRVIEVLEQIENAP